MRTFTNYDVNDGLQSDEFNGGAYAIGQNGEMFFGGINGYNSFFPEKIIENSYIPPVVFTSFRVFDSEVKLDTAIIYKKNITLDYTDNFFSFEFASLDYGNPEKNQYVYKLEGFDQNWVRSGNRRYAKYTNLDGGDYVFRVKGSNSDGIWNVGGASLTITINPPIWATWWFRILAVIVVLSVIYSVYSYRMRKIDQQRKFLEDQIAERTWEINERNKQLIASKKDTDNILNNVEEGIFLLTSKMEIGTQYSSALENILETGSLARKNFVDLLENAVTHKTHTSISEFLEFMFRDDVDEQALVDLNPMSQIKIAFQTKDTKKTKAKHLAFKFKRIPNEEGSTRELIVTVNDISDQIRLARELEESQETGKKQIEWMLSILHIEPQLLREFMEGATQELNYIDYVLQQSDKETDLHRVLDKIFRSMHLIKGNAALVDLKFFIEKAHEFEENITHIQEKESITGTDFVPLVLMLREMRTILVELDRLVDRISKIHMNFRPKRSYEKKLFNTSLLNLVTTMAHDVNKKIELITDDFDAGMIPYRYRLLTRQILIQMLRNSVYHGIESVEERELAGKNPLGTITIISLKNEDSFGFRLIDDGRGLLIDKLRAKALKLQRWTEAEIGQWDDDQVAQAIFTAGISTLDNANLIAGRGVGLDVVKDKVTEAGGRISVKYETGRFCEFIITIPLKTEVPVEEQVETEAGMTV
jgi:signal transduction histidine kinase